VHHHLATADHLVEATWPSTLEAISEVRTPGVEDLAELIWAAAQRTAAAAAEHMEVEGIVNPTQN
jgi:hypothetical protein